jgi:ferredoxin
MGNDDLAKAKDIEITEDLLELAHEAQESCPVDAIIIK